MYPALTFSDFVLFHFVSFVSLPFYYGHTFQKNRSCRIFVIHFLSLHNFVVIPKIRSKIRRCNKKVSTEQELSVRVAKSQRKTSCYFIFRCLTWKLTWLADNFLQNKSNFFICSQFRLEENFFKCVFFIEVSVYWALLNWTKQCTARYLLVQNCPHYCFSQHRCARGEFCPCCSKRNANHALMMFLKFIYSKNVKINKLLLKRRKVNLRCARWSIFTLKNRLKINAEAVLEHGHLNNFLHHPTMVGYIQV